MSRLLGSNMNECIYCQKKAENHSHASSYILNHISARATGIICSRQTCFSCSFTGTTGWSRRWWCRASWNGWAGFINSCSYTSLFSLLFHFFVHLLLIPLLLFLVFLSYIFATDLKYSMNYTNMHTFLFLFFPLFFLPVFPSFLLLDFLLVVFLGTRGPLVILVCL